MVQSTGARALLLSSRLTRLKGLDPKNPRRALSGEGCTDSTHGTGPSSGFSDWACRPHRIAAHGPPRSASAVIARSVIASQPLPWWLLESPGRTVSTG